MKNAFPVARLCRFATLAALLPTLRAEVYVGDGAYVRNTAFALGTIENPYATFKEAGLAAAGTGQDVTILAGTYAGQNITASGTAANTLVFNAQAGVTILNDGTLAAVKSDALNISGSYVQFNGARIIGNAGDPAITPAAALQNIYVKDSKFNTNGVVVESSHVTVSNCVVTNTTGSGMRIQGQTSTPTDYVSFTGNVVANCGWYTPVGSGAGIVVAAIKPEDTSAAAKVLIQGNLVYACQGRLISNVDTKNFATLTLDEGQGIMLTRIDTYTTGAIAVDNNVVMFSGSKAISSQFGQGTLVTHNTTYLDGTTGFADPTPILINKTLNAQVLDNLLVTYARNNGVNLMGTPAETASVTVSGNVVAYEGSAIFGGAAPGSLVKTDLSVTAGADNATVAALQAKLAAVLDQAQPAQLSWYIPTSGFYEQQVAYMMLNGTTKRTVSGIDYTAIRLDRRDPAGARQYAANLDGTPAPEVLGVVRTDPASSAAMNFNNRTRVFTQWEDNDTDGASPVTRYVQNGFRLTTNNRLQTYFVDGGFVAAAGGDGSDYLMMQREGSLLTLTSDTAGQRFRMTSVDLGATAGMHGTLHVVGERAGVVVASGDFVYDDTMRTYLFSSLGGDWSDLDLITMARSTGVATDANGVVIDTNGDFRTYLDNIVVTAIPEPATYGALGACALAGFAGVRRRRRVSPSV